MKAHPVAGLARINLTFRRLDPQTATRRARLQVRAEGGAEGLALAGLELHAVQLLDRLCKRCTGCLLRQAPIGGLLLYRQTAPLLYLFVRT